jgi:hypothetical protein
VDEGLATSISQFDLARGTPHQWWDQVIWTRPRRSGSLDWVGRPSPRFWSVLDWLLASGLVPDCLDIRTSSSPNSSRQAPVVSSLLSSSNQALLVIKLYYMFYCTVLYISKNSIYYSSSLPAFPPLSEPLPDPSTDFDLTALSLLLLSFPTTAITPPWSPVSPLPVLPLPIFLFYINGSQ